MEGLVLTALSHNCATSKGKIMASFNQQLWISQDKTVLFFFFFYYVSNEYFTSFHITVEELWTKSYGKHLEKSSFLTFQFCLLSQLFLIKTEESLEKFNSRRGIGKTNNTVHAQESRQASLTWNCWLEFSHPKRAGSLVLFFHAALSTSLRQAVWELWFYYLLLSMWLGK